MQTEQMTIELTVDQQQMIDVNREDPPKIIDPRTHTAYFLIRSDEYERLKAIIEEETRQRAINRMARRNAINYAEETA